MHKVEIARVRFDAVTYADALTFVEVHIKTGKTAYITTPNPEMVLKAEKNAEFSRVLKSAKVLF